MNIAKPLIRKKTKDVLEQVDKPEIFIKSLQELFQAYVDPVGTKNYQRIIPNTGKFYGVPKPILRVIAAEIGKFLQQDPIHASALLRVIWDEGSFEAKQITGISLEKIGRKNPKLCLEFVSSVLPDLDNWSVCDTLAMSGVEPIVYSTPAMVLPLSERWIQSHNKWIRRFGVVTLRGYKRVKTTTTVFQLLDLVMEDNENVVKKAVSWVLREITKKNPDEVTAFLTRWAQAPLNKVAKWIIKNGMTKLPNRTQRELLALIS